MKFLINKRNLLIILITFIFLFLTHLPLMTKNILSADILLNNVFYNGYSWEISLGRFGLYVVGLLKCFLTIPTSPLSFGPNIFKLGFAIKERFSNSLEVITFLVFD